VLPDYPMAKEKLRKILESEFHKARESDSLGVSEEWIEEGDAHVLHRSDGSVDSTDFHCDRSVVEILPEEYLTLTWNDVLQRIRNAGRELGKSQASWTLEQVKDMTLATGNYIDVGGEFTAEHFFKMLDKLEVPFTDEGAPILPTIYGGEDVLNSFKGVLTQIDSDPVHRARGLSLMVAKREQWRDRENNRRLVD